MSRETFSDTAIERLRSGRVLVLTGAGVSAESGLATFRGADGLWAGAWTLEINPEQTALSDRVDERIAARSGSALPALLDAAALGAA